MWSAIRWMVLRLAAIRWLFKLGWLGMLVPIVLLLKTIGLPLLGILSVVAIPLLILLFLFGLPIILVLVFGGVGDGLPRLRADDRPRGGQDRPLRRAPHLADGRCRAQTVLLDVQARRRGEWKRLAAQRANAAVVSSAVASAGAFDPL